METKIQQFLKSFINPDDNDIKNFVDAQLEEDSTLNVEELTENVKTLSEKHSQQSSSLYKLEEEFADYSELDEPQVDEFKKLLYSAYDINSELEDVSEDIDRLRNILDNLKNDTEKTDEQGDEVAPDVSNLLARIQQLKSDNAHVLDEETQVIEETEIVPEEKAIEIAQDEEIMPEKTEIAYEEENEAETEDFLNADSVVSEEKEDEDEEGGEEDEEEVWQGTEISDAGNEVLETSDLMRRLGGGKSELSEILDEKIGDRGSISAKEAASGEPVVERELVKDIVEDRLARDVEARIKSIQERHEWAMEEKESVSLIERLKDYLSKDTDEIEDYDPDLHGPLVSFEGLDGHEEVERYWVNEPYAFVVILNNIEKNENIYYVVEPKLSRFEDLFLKEIKDRLRDVLLVEDVIPESDKNLVLTRKVRELVRDYNIDLTPIILEKILYYIKRDFVGFGLIDAIQEDDRIEDVSCNGHDVPIYLYHKQYTNIATNVVFNEDGLDSFIIKLAQRSGKHISVAEPMIDATMPDGSRIQMTLSKHVTANGGTFTIRKFADVPLSPIDLVNWKTFSSETMAYLWLCIENNKSLIFAGGTASGKTSSLNAVALFIPRQAKVISLEDTRELKLPHPNWIPAVTRDSFTVDERGGIDMYELLRGALRQRPEYLLVGEVRGKEALTLFQAMSTGHTTFSTMHADSVASAIHRLENPPISVPRSMIQALNIISIQSQTYHKGKRVRRNLKMVEITDIDPQTRNIRTNEIFSWDSLTDTFQRVGESKALNDIMTTRAWTKQDVKRELNYREKIIDFLVRNNILDYHTVSTVIYEYSINPEKVLQKLKIIN
ncbi:MAG: Flp pilus assembly complex ATPase component TadA [ANME-2 cluster archaeon]|nr:Flp pilus assembly complex ATPase component TadA [ANME-2 cluster archaeon]